MENYDSIFAPKEEDQNKTFAPFDKQAWVEKKQAERQMVYVALPDEFDKLLATMRSREISVSIIIQNMAQLKALFEKQWESIVGNNDLFLYMGGNEQWSLFSKRLHDFRR